MTVWHAGAQPSATVFARQIGRCAGLVDEDESRRIEIELSGESFSPSSPSLQHARALLLGRVRALFLNVTL
jgi:hypothetical protein